jgi:putative ABC transport system permease protein
MLKATVKGVLAHKRRLTSVFLAVFLGIAFLTGTLILGDTIRRSFDNLLATSNSGIDAVVRRSDSVAGDSSSISNRQRGLVPDSLATTIAGVPGVAAAQGDVQSRGVRLLDKKGQTIGGTGRGVPAFGGSWRQDPTMNPFRIAEGKAPTGPNDVVIDRGSAKQAGYAVGEDIRILVPDAQTFRISGIATFGAEDTLGGGSAALFALPTAERLLAQPGQVNSIVARAEAGVSQDALVKRIEPVLPANTEALTGAAAVKETQDSFQQRISGFTRFLSSFGFIAVIVGAFVIYNTFSILVAQRTRELALLRAIGAGRRQVLGSVLVEAAIVGVTATAVGVLGGIGVGAALRGLFGAAGFTFPPGGLVLTRGTIVLAFVTGGVVTTLAAVLPAIRAARVAPLAALQEAAADTSATSRRRLVAGVVVVALGLLEIARGMVNKHPQPIGLGAGITLIGTIVVGPAVAQPMSRIIGWPAARLRGVTGNLARENAMRNPRRTAGTASALLVGVAVVTFFTVLAASLQATTNDQIDRTFVGDLSVSIAGFGGGLGFSPNLAHQIGALPEVAVSAPVRLSDLEVEGSGERAIATDPVALSRVLTIDLVAGSLANLGAQQIAVSDTRARDAGLKLGDTVNVRYPQTGTHPFTIAAIYKTSDVVDAPFVLSTLADDANATHPLDQQIFVKFRSGVDFEQGRAAVAKTAAAYPNARVQDAHQLKEMYTSRINTFLAVIFGMLALAVVIALIGVSNTLQLSVHERTRELGLLRAVGSTREQLRSMVRWEAAIIALFGTIGGVLLGVAFAWAIIHGLGRDQNVLFRIPFARAGVILAAGAVAGILAAVLPARRAGRLEMLRAIAAE